MNPMDWLNCYRIIKVEFYNRMDQDTRVVLEHFKLMIRSYLHLLVRVDSVIASALGEHQPKSQMDPCTYKDASDAQIIDEPWSIIVGKVENDSLKFYVIKVEDIPALNENTFNIILQRLVLNKRNPDSKRRDETVLRFRWWGEVRRVYIRMKLK